LVSVTMNVMPSPTAMVEKTGSEKGVMVAGSQ
jgi:hypothetical protein